MTKQDDINNECILKLMRALGRHISLETAGKHKQCKLVFIIDKMDSTSKEKDYENCLSNHMQARQKSNMPIGYYNKDMRNLDIMNC